MRIMKTEAILIEKEQDIVAARKRASEMANEAGFNTLGKTKLVTATSELTRNILVHATSGKVLFQIVEDGFKKGIQIIFEDQGPGIADIEQAMTDGFTTKGSLGMGLSGSKRLVHEFMIESALGKGTRICILLWK